MRKLCVPCVFIFCQAGVWTGLVLDNGSHAISQYDSQRRTPDDSWSMMLSVLDSVQTVMTGHGAYDRRQFQTIVSALTQFDPQLYHSQENGWRGLIAYYQAGGGVDDLWGQTPSKYGGKYKDFITIFSLYILVSGSWSEMQLTYNFLTTRISWCLSHATLPPTLLTTT